MATRIWCDRIERIVRESFEDVKKGVLLGQWLMVTTAPEDYSRVTPTGPTGPKHLVLNSRFISSFEPVE